MILARLFRFLFAVLLLAAAGLLVTRGGAEVTPLARVARPHPSRPDCARCHSPNSILITDVTRPECAECHLPPGHSPGRYLRIASSPGKGDDAGQGGTGKIIEQNMVRVPAGPFLMGNNGRPSPEGPGDEDETPAHSVTIAGFWIDRYEVTNAHYKRFVDATAHPAPVHWRTGSYPPGKANHPVVYVSWYDAREFCQWAGKRLPSEAEWEKAARGTDGRHFPWGNSFDPMRANTPQYWLAKGFTPEQGDTMPVGSFEAGKSPYGLYDMAGNVYEWVEDWYKPYPGNQYPNPFYGERDKILRGGSWYDCLSYGCGLSSPSYNRSRFTPEIKNSGFGFRCAKSK